MDEVDGMSAGDRGGVGALNAMIKKSKVNILPLPLHALEAITNENCVPVDSHHMHCQ